MLMYARTINKVRGYFADFSVKSQTNAPELNEYLVLPIDDNFPNFFEAWHTVFFMTILIGFVNGVIVGVGLLNMGFIGLDCFSSAGIFFTMISFVVISTILHVVIYWISTNRRERKWKEDKSSIPAYRNLVK
mgnify:FL=1